MLLISTHTAHKNLYMPHFVHTREISHAAALSMLQAGVERATQLGVPECIVVVDPRGRVVASVRMSGAKFTSLQTAQAKAVTAASYGKATGGIPAEFEDQVAFGSQGTVTNLRGGLPIEFEGHILGGIGVGSGSPEQDLEVGTAALDVLRAP